ncbi:unnamed protein product [Lactuca virosa]|uniref:Uncharacterized protein n=1 Tax=Lactuca virosa TaxID=75947 RepID=A0AAU9PSH0_9ASTR|nr:unnamed protein product [Lactuca virosa]
MVVIKATDSPFYTLAHHFVPNSRVHIYPSFFIYLPTNLNTVTLTPRTQPSFTLLHIIPKRSVVRSFSRKFLCFVLHRCIVIQFADCCLLFHIF